MFSRAQGWQQYNRGRQQINHRPVEFSMVPAIGPRNQEGIHMALSYLGRGRGRLSEAGLEPPETNCVKPLCLEPREQALHHIVRLF